MAGLAGLRGEGRGELLFLLLLMLTRGLGAKKWWVANIVHVVYAWGILFEVVHGGF